MRSPPAAAATRPGRARVREGPADVGPGGLFRDEPYSVGFSFGLGAGKGSGSKSSQPTGIVKTLPSDIVICSVSMGRGISDTSNL